MIYIWAIHGKMSCSSKDNTYVKATPQIIFAGTIGIKYEIGERFVIHTNRWSSPPTLERIEGSECSVTSTLPPFCEVRAGAQSQSHIRISV